MQQQLHQQQPLAGARDDSSQADDVLKDRTDTSEYLSLLGQMPVAVQQQEAPQAQDPAYVEHAHACTMPQGQ
jgi:hypothetical protein